MTTLSFPTEKAYLDYSQMLSEQMPNIKLNTLRKAMAGVDHYRSVKSYRDALKAAESTNQGTDKGLAVAYLDVTGTLHIHCLTRELSYGFDDIKTDSMIDALNDQIENIIGGDYGFLLQNLSAKKIGEGLYEVYGNSYINIESPSDIYGLLTHLFQSDGREQFNTYRVAKHAVEKALEYIESDNINDIIDIDETEYCVNVDEFLLPFSSDDVRDAVSDETRNDFDNEVMNEADAGDLSIDQISAQSGQNIMGELIELALRLIKAESLTSESKQALLERREPIAVKIACEMVLNQI